MSTVSDNNKRIAKNTLILYARMFLVMFISLYTSRIILKTLGISDFGICNDDECSKQCYVGVYTAIFDF